MKAETLGRRLAEARSHQELTQAEVAVELGIPRSAVAQIECGRRSVSALELRDLARLYERDVESLLEFRETSPAIYRSREGVDYDTEVLPVLNRILEAAKPRRVRPNLLPLYELPSPPDKKSAQEQGSLVAESERQRLNLGGAPIARLASLLKIQGITVLGEDFENDDVSGVFVIQKDTGPVVIVNKNHGLPRLRFSLAHEYGHAVIDRESAYRVSSGTNRSDLAETRANAFAAAFILPEQGVRQVLGALGKARRTVEEDIVYDGSERKGEVVSNRSGRSRSCIDREDALEIADFFGTSYQAAVYRLRSLRYITWPICKELLGEEQRDSVDYRTEMDPVGESWRKA